MGKVFELVTKTGSVYNHSVIDGSIRISREGKPLPYSSYVSSEDALEVQRKGIEYSGGEDFSKFIELVRGADRLEPWEIGGRIIYVSADSKIEKLVIKSSPLIERSNRI